MRTNHADEEFERAMNAQPEQGFLAKFRREGRERLPKNDAGECCCETCGSVIPEPEWYCKPCAAAEKAAYEKRKRILDINNAFDRCASLGGFPHWPWARLDNPEFRSAVSPKLLRAVEKWDPTKGNLVLAADTGKGKTSLIRARLCQFRDMAIAQAEAGQEPKWFLYLFTSALDLVAARRTHRLGSEEPELIERAMSTNDVLVIDEVGFEDNRDQLILELADRRYRDRGTTVVTTGRTPEAFADRYGAATWRRFVEGGNVVVDFGEAK